MLRNIAAVLALIAMTQVAAAQHPQPYAGLEQRAIKALSADEIADLEAGRGMGLALAAELNGYPGPRHVIELAEPLALTSEQRGEVEALFRQMEVEAVRLGERLIEQESELDRQFAEKRIDEARLAAATQEIGATAAALRAAHLRYHLLTAELLTAEQLQRYADLRGYSDAPSAPAPHGGHMHPR